MNRRPIINRGDLLLGFKYAPGVPKEFLAEFLGYELAAVDEVPTSKEKQLPTHRTKDLQSAIPATTPTPAPRRAVAPASDVRYWMAVRAESYEPETRHDHWLHTAAPLTEAELTGSRAPLPAKPPLLPWSRLWPYLRTALGTSRTSRRLDERRLLQGVASLRPLQRLPRRRFTTWADTACVLVDRRAALTPFWDDAEALIGQLIQQRGREGLLGGWLDDGLPEGLIRPFGKHGLSRIAIPSGVPVLVVGDLGQLGTDPALLRAWADFGRQLRAQGNPIQALLPCPRERWTEELASLWPGAAWDRGGRLPRGGEGLRPRVWDREARDSSALVVEKVLSLMAMAVRVEPGLLRTLRYLLASEGADIGAEFDAWSHAEVTGDYLARMVLPEAALRRRKDLKTEVSSRRPILRTQLAAFRESLARFHAGYGAVLRARETLNLLECGAPVDRKSVTAARETLKRAGATLLQIVRNADVHRAEQLGLPDWVVREIPRVSIAGRNTEELGIAWGLTDLWFGPGPGKAGRPPLPEGINPEHVRFAAAQGQALGEELWWEVRQEGNQVRLQRRLQPGSGIPSERVVNGSPSGWLPARRPSLGLRIVDLAGKIEDYPLVADHSKGIALPLSLPQASRITLASDSADLELLALPKPSWASRFGRDQAGIYAEFVVAKVIFRLRWITPGGFFMGSPETEPGRQKNEQRHWVTLTKGFWLGETVCTQLQWEAVMGQKPSQFKGAQRPVEKVSWNDCWEFCERLQTLIPDLVFRLPTEAEWEYACRAGTETAFNDGSPCTVPEGKDPALEPLGWHAESVNGQTHPVREKVANAWGLYDLHGNVWEWCADQCDYGAEGFVTSTYVEGIADPCCQKGANRVVRGGSCWFDARYCRSAYRNGFEPGARSSYLGFRLAAGQPASGESGAPGGADGRRDDDQAATTGRGAGVRRVRRPKLELTRPDWATRVDADQFGRFAEFGVKGVVFQLRWISPGRFLMGSPMEETGHDDDEGPQHSVILTRGFWLGTTPCTQAQWVAVMGRNPSCFKGDQRPVESVNWNECEEFCARIRQAVPGLPARLPTEAEWEFACRAGTASGFNDGTNCTLPTGKDPALDKLGWYDENSGKETHSVGGKLPNRWGLYDMHGNIWEWCVDGKRSYAEGEQLDPIGPTNSAGRVVRGGSCWDGAGGCRSAYRVGVGPGDRGSGLGFRLAAGQLASGESGAPGGADGRRDDDQAEPTRRGAGGKKQGKESRKKKSALERLGDLFK